jgi:ABC-2 type transport system permease protein
MTTAWAHARAETVALLRMPAYCLPTLALPGLALLVFGGRVGEGEPERLVAGFAAMAVLGVTFFQFGVGIATNRQFLWESYLRTLPAGPGARLGGRILSALGFALASTLVVGVVGAAVYGATLPFPRALAVLVALLLGGVPFALLGIAFGYWTPPRAALPIANLAFVPLVVAGAFWARLNGLSQDADVALQLVPTRSWMEVLDALATGDHPVPLHHVAALVGWSVAFGALAWWGYRRDEGERFT